MYFDLYLGSHAMLCRHFFSKCHVIIISKIFGDFVSLCQGLLPTSRHFEHRQEEGPGDEVARMLCGQRNTAVKYVRMPVVEHFRSRDVVLDQSTSTNAMELL